MPTLAEIRARTPNGLTLVSTFSGCGGSCLGFRMAGYRVLWASEFVDAARETYQANSPDVPVDARDIRQVTARDIREVIGDVDVDVLEGSPPCASFSTAGNREADWGKVKAYSDNVRQRTDDLFWEYARLVDELRPRVFVAENVSGLVKGAAKGMFIEILQRLRKSGDYVVEARMLDAQWLGVPQQRQRLIFIGVRRDLGRTPVFPTPLPYRYTLRDVLPHIQHVQSHGEKWDARKPAPTIKALDGHVVKTANRASAFVEAAVEPEAWLEKYATGAEYVKLKPGQSSDKYFNLVRANEADVAPTITATGGQPGAAGPTHPTECRKFSIGELKRIGSFPDDFVLTGSFAQQWERIGRAVPPLMMRAVAETLRRYVFGQE